MAALRAGLPVTNKKHHTFSSTAGTHDPHHTWHGDRGGSSHFCIPNCFFHPISSFDRRKEIRRYTSLDYFIQSSKNRGFRKKHRVLLLFGSSPVRKHFSKMR